MTGCIEHRRLSRRTFAKGAASLALWTGLPHAAIAGARDPRLLTIVLRGGMDGLAFAAPVGDPDYVRLAGRLAIPATGDGAGLKLDDLFVLNKAMPFIHSLYLKREAIVLHAVASPYRGRSHFDGQDVLESGLGGVGRSDSGWLNRALERLHSAGSADLKGLAMGPVVPLVMRGRAPVTSWIPKVNNFALVEDTIERLMDLYAHTDQRLAGAFAEGIAIERLAKAAGSEEAAAMTTPAAKPGNGGPNMMAGQQTGAPQMAGQPGMMAGQAAVAPTQPAAKPAPNQPRPFREFIETAEAAAKFLSSPGGPRIGALSFDGWDTHANEGPVNGGLSQRFSGLDATLKAFAVGMGPAWNDTIVLLVTEFGRTARMNGTNGTDHGTGTAALMLGGAVKGGRVIADWPGLKDTDLFENRDLKPTRDLRSVMKGILRDHIGIPDAALATEIFPDSAAIKPLDGLVA